MIMRTLLLFAGLCTAAPGMAAGGDSQADHRPNIVFILADDKYVLGDGTPRECLEKLRICGDSARSSRCGESR